jgi:hypothetical protein
VQQRAVVELALRCKLSIGLVFRACWHVILELLLFVISLACLDCKLAAHHSPVSSFVLGVCRCADIMQLLWHKAAVISPACSLPALTMGGHTVSFLR